MKKYILMASVAILTFGITAESWAETTCNWEGTKLIIGGSGTFNGCDSVYDDDDNEIDWETQRKKITEIEFGDNVTAIGDYAFQNASSLKSITIPKGVTSIGVGAFNKATGLTSITIPDSVTSIETGAFAGASSLTSITIPKGVTFIGDSAFTGASSLTSITIPEGVTSIGNNAFNSATGLTSITIPDSVTSIGEAAFLGATGLTSITIPEGVTSIGPAAFYNATGLKNITIPDSVTSIGGWAFMNATGLTSITIPDSVTSIGLSAFLFTDSLTNIICKGDEVSCTAIADALEESGYDRDIISYPADKTSCESSDISMYVWDSGKCRRRNEEECNSVAKYYYSDGICKSMPGSKTTCKNADFLWSESSCVKSCASGFVEWDKECLSEYPFAKKRWTPAEASQWLHDGNDNFVVITFKK